MRKISRILLLLIAVIICLLLGLYWYLKPFIGFTKQIHSQSYIGFDGQFITNTDKSENLLLSILNCEGAIDGVMHTGKVKVSISDTDSGEPIIEIYHDSEKDIAAIGPAISYIVNQVAKENDSFIIGLLGDFTSNIDVNIDVDQLSEITGIDIIPKISAGEVLNVSWSDLIFAARPVTQFPHNEYDNQSSGMHKLHVQSNGMDVYIGIKQVGETHLCYYANDNMQMLLQFYPIDDSYDFDIPEPNISETVIRILKSVFDQFSSNSN